MNSRIDGVVVRPLVQHVDARGSLTEILRCDWSEYERFGQAVVTVNLPGVIRGWHRHGRQTDRIVVLQGSANVPLYDGRPASPTYRALEEHKLGPDAFALISVPPGVYHGYRTTSQIPAIILNFPTELYDPASPDEERIPYDTPTIPYQW